MTFWCEGLVWIYLIRLGTFSGVNLKVNFTLQQAIKAQDVVEVQLNSFFNLRAGRGFVAISTPRPLYCRERDPLPIYRRLGGPQGPSGRLRKILPPPGFDPRTVRPVARHTTMGGLAKWYWILRLHKKLEIFSLPYVLLISEAWIFCNENLTYCISRFLS
jgi:hypothetical protein